MSDKGIIQLIRIGALGDLLMCSSVLPGLKQQGYRTRFICHEVNAHVLQDNPYLDELVPVSTSYYDEARKYTEHMEPASREVIMEYEYHGPGLPRYAPQLHATTILCSQVGVPASEELSIHIPPDVLQWGETYQNSILIQTNAVYSIYKMWPLDRWKALAEMIRSLLGCEVLQVGSPNDPEVPGVPKLVSPSLKHSIAALKHCGLFIGIDSVLNHATRALQKPSIILWGSSSPRLFGYAQNLNIVNGVRWNPQMGDEGALLRCQPCLRDNRHTHQDPKMPCPHTVPYPAHCLPQDVHPNQELHACMASITVQSVFGHILQFLKE